MPTNEQVDIVEDNILQLSPELLAALLIDRSTSSADQPQTIFWATDDYAHLGKGYQYKDPILPHLITGEHGRIIMPRVLKERELQSARTKERAEVFTPSWLCNRMNNAADEQWFGKPQLFNKETGEQTWQTFRTKVRFPRGKKWQEYVKSIKLEITCGEAPFLVSRYDTTTGTPISIDERIGLLDRKLRVVGENTTDETEWIEWALTALRSTYAYEWQGDNLLLARENILYTFIDYYEARFSTPPDIALLMQVAEIISWNVWQMDGLKCVVPDSCHEEVTVVQRLFDTEETRTPCPGCTQDNVHLHNGIKCRIMDWKKGEAVLFIDSMK